MFKQLGIRYVDVDLDKLQPHLKREIMDYMLSTTGARTVPRIFASGTCIGGRDDLKNLLRRGEAWRFQPKKKAPEAKRKYTTRRPKAFMSGVDMPGGPRPA